MSERDDYSRYSLKIRTGIYYMDCQSTWIFANRQLK